MSEQFDPYHRWLGISPKDQPPNYYRLLGIDLFESDPEVIRDAAEQRIAHVRTYQLGRHMAVSQKILNELGAAKACLLDRVKKAAYDATLQESIAAAAAAPPEPEVPPLQPEATPPQTTSSADELASPQIEVQPLLLLPPLRRRARWWREKRTRFILVAVAAACLIVLAFLFVGRGSKEPRPAAGPQQQPSPAEAELKPIHGTAKDVPSTQSVLEPGTAQPAPTASSAGPLPAETAGTPAGTLTVRKLGEPGPLEILDDGKPVLCYNYQLVPEPPEVRDRIQEGNKKYAVPRSDYIHPLYGLRGEVLTKDWSPDHPHHRGIYWAWPEVDWRRKRGDLHALQQVFSRPTGKIRTEQGAGFAQIEAENEWRWEDRTPIVREEAVIRVHAQNELGRAIDLSFRFLALGDDVLVARRGQAQYGGLNIRLSAVQEQEITPFTDPAGTTPQRAWAQRSGTAPDGASSIGLTILQSHVNPDYPGDWVQYPNLSWIQATFPRSGTRYTISKSRPLELRYRLWIHDKKVEPALAAKLWDDYNLATK